MNHQKLVSHSCLSKTILRSVRGILFLVLLLTSLLLINVAQTLSLLVLPFSRRYFRAFNRYCALYWWGACVWLGVHCNGIRLKITGDDVPLRENAIVFANHQKMADIYVLMLFAMTKGRLGDLKWFVKDILKYVPGAGWGMLFLDCLFIKRNWDADKNKIAKTFAKFKEDKIPIWLISFVEGTRITPSKVNSSQEYAKAKGLPHFENVLVPRTKGFVSTVQGLAEHVDAVYDVTIIYPDTAPNLWQLFNGTVTDFEIKVNRFNIAELPSTADNAALSAWLMQRYVEKDAYIGERFAS